jgi:adenosylcobinamide kinase/adenosylcobinamide-phosphate guanylyltransferase
MIVLITGPVRSGKSTRALGIARAFACPVTHVVTARADPADDEMVDRIARHRIERGADPVIDVWAPQTRSLADIVAAAAPGTTLLVDSIGTWVAGHLLDLESLAERDAPATLARLEAFAQPFLDRLPTVRANVVCVAEETGWGLVPVSAQGRIFRDHLGRLTRRIAHVAQRVELVVAGYALDLRGCGIKV